MSSCYGSISDPDDVFYHRQSIWFGLMLHDPLKMFPLLLAFDALGSHRPYFQSLNGDILLAYFTDTIGAVINTGKGVTDLFYQFAFTVLYPNLQIKMLIKNSLLHRVCIGAIAFLDISLEALKQAGALRAELIVI